MADILNSGFVPVVLDGEERKLVASVGALIAVSSIKDGTRPLYESLVNRNLGVMALLLKIGLNLSDKEARDLPELIFKSGGTVALVSPLIEYLSLLENGGQPPAKETAEETPAGKKRKR